MNNLKLPSGATASAVLHFDFYRYFVPKTAIAEALKQLGQNKPVYYFVKKRNKSTFKASRQFYGLLFYVCKKFVIS